MSFLMMLINTSSLYVNTNKRKSLIQLSNDVASKYILLIEWMILRRRTNLRMRADIF